MKKRQKINTEWTLQARSNTELVAAVNFQATFEKSIKTSLVKYDAKKKKQKLKKENNNNNKTIGYQYFAKRNPKKKALIANGIVHLT